jgi:hypothetical protein
MSPREIWTMDEPNKDEKSSEIAHWTKPKELNNG